MESVINSTMARATTSAMSTTTVATSTLKMATSTIATVTANIINSTTMEVASSTTIAPSISSGGIKYREDGLREPPTFIAANNVIIMIIGLSILILPVVGFMVYLCARTKLFQSIKGLKLMSSDGDGLPYSHFDSDSEEITPRSMKKSKPNSNAKAPMPKDVRVLMNNDNTVIGSPNKNSRTTSTTMSTDVCRTLMNPSSSSSTTRNAGEIDDYDATFIMPAATLSISSSEQYSS